MSIAWWIADYKLLSGGCYQWRFEYVCGIIDIGCLLIYSILKDGTATLFYFYQIDQKKFLF